MRGSKSPFDTILTAVVAARMDQIHDGWGGLNPVQMGAQAAFVAMREEDVGDYVRRFRTQLRQLMQKRRQKSLRK